MKEEQFQISLQILQELEEYGLKITKRSRFDCELNWKELEISISFRNILAQIEQSPEQKDSLIRQFVQQILEQIQPSTSQRKTFWARVLPFSEKKKLSYPWTETLIANHLEVSLVEERDKSLCFLNPLDIVSKGLSLNKLKQESFLNLIWAFEQLEWQTFEEGIWGVEDNNGVSSAMVLLLGKKFPMKKEKIAIPTRNHLWICSDDNKLPFFASKVRGVYERYPYPISPKIFSWSEHFDRFYTEFT